MLRFEFNDLSQFCLELVSGKSCRIGISIGSEHSEKRNRNEHAGHYTSYLCTASSDKIAGTPVKSQSSREDNKQITRSEISSCKREPTVDEPLGDEDQEATCRQQ